MELVKFDDVGVESWDTFCVRSRGAWLLHTSFWLKYTLALYTGERENHSFAVVENGQIIAISPLIAEARNVGNMTLKELTFNGEACPLPAVQNGITEKKRKRVLDYVFSTIDELAKKIAAKRTVFRQNILALDYYKSSGSVFNELVRYGFLEVNLYTQSINLELDDDSLFKKMRSGHRQSINKALEAMHFVVYSQENASPDIFDGYRKMHEKAAGRQTRSPRTFNMMYDLILQGNAVLCSAALDGTIVGYALAFCYKRGALYASACNDPAYKNAPIGHGIQWELMRYLKSQGVERYEVGLQAWPQLHYIPSDKERSISKFKRGFGGDMVPVFSGEKFYDSKIMQLSYQRRLQAYVENGHAEPMG